MSQFIEMFGVPMTNSKGWVEYGKINQYAQIVLGSTPNSKEVSYWDGNIKWITPAEMTDESYYIYDTDRHITEDGVKSASLTLLPYRSVLFSTRAPIGKVGLVGSPMYCNQGFKNFICGDKLNPVYLYYTLIYKREYLVSLGTGTTFKELSKRTVEGLDIAIPPLSLQEQFENIYHQADKSEFVGCKSQFIEMFGGIQNDSKWPLRSLEELCYMINGYAFRSNHYSDDGYSIIRIANVQKGSIDDSEKVYYPELLKDEFRDSILAEGDILVSLTGNVGRVGVIYKEHLPAALNQRVQGLRIKDSFQLNHQYLYSLLNLDEFENLCVKNASGSAQLNLSTVWLRNCKIVCPSLEEQKRFAQIAEQADKSEYYN